MKTSRIELNEKEEVFPHLRKVIEPFSPFIILVTSKTKSGNYIGTVVQEDKKRSIGYTDEWVLYSEPFTGSVTLQG